MSGGRVIRIGNGAGFWGDDVDAPVRLARDGQLDYLTLEYLAELTLSILAYQQSKRPAAGFVTDFPDLVGRLAPLLHAQPQLKIVTNAGGMNPRQCAIEVSRQLDRHNLSALAVAAVDGDDIKPRLAELQAHGIGFDNLDDGRAFDEVRDRVVSANVYLGAQGIVDALLKRARIVITGRVADAALVVGPVVHEFGWSWDDWNRLGKATVAGHLIECGGQVTGGIDSTWSAAVDLDNLGYPIAEIAEPGDFVITKPPGTGGRVNRATVTEQLVYEIGDPRRYLTPDVTADFSNVQVRQDGPDRVRVSGGTGTGRPEQLKVSMAYQDGYMASGTIVIVGAQAADKARYAGQLIAARLKSAGAMPESFHYEVLGGGDTARGVIAADRSSWDVVLRICGRDATREPLNRMVRELAPLVTAGPPGVTGYTGSRPRPHPVFAFWPALIPRAVMQPQCEVAPASQWAAQSGGGEP